ncbi:hypothetical protein GGS21DRAFT_521884 [Xylaria nigripes]|nr:hypothetical protein GGS21DRAFT_521884 [Xylaria nigripes]
MYEVLKDNNSVTQLESTRRQFRIPRQLCNCSIMLAKTLSLALFAAGAAIASPCDVKGIDTSSIGPGDPFGVVAIRSGSEIHFSGLQAARNSIFLGLTSQNATCYDCSNPSYATFTLSNDGGLYLYSEHGPSQQLFVDRSGMGQGKLGYTTGDVPGPQYGERATFSIDEYGHLTFNGESFIACPHSVEDAWSVWVNVGNPNPGYNKGCMGFLARAFMSSTPLHSCIYTGN